MLDQEATVSATGTVTVIYIAYASDKGCECVQQFYGSFELADCYLILIVTKLCEDIQEPVH